MCRCLYVDGHVCVCMMYVCMYFALTGSMVDSDLHYEPGEQSSSDSASISCVTLGGQLPSLGLPVLTCKG